MKKNIVLLLFLFAVISVNLCSAQIEDIFDKRKTNVESLNIYKGSIIDSTSDVLKELIKLQNDVIRADEPLIEIYLDSLKTQTDSLKIINENLANDKIALETKAKDNKLILFYGAIGAGVIFILFILFLILFFVATGKKNKFKKQINDNEKIIQANKKDIELSRKDAETLKKEIISVKENNDKEVKNLRAKIDSQDTEKANFEKRLFEKNSLIDNISKEKFSLSNDLTNYKNLYNLELNERKIAEEKLAGKELECNENNSQINSKEVEDLTSENTRLTEEIKKLDSKLEKEVKTKNMIEDELRKFIEELRNPH
ncbi:MAG: hypothetical protein HGB12_09135 [Bacteroidetes bacterium]|nr:hypothetical protein [Bacteroidota bacterium]